ncbi:MAG: hypothetical protein K2M54_07690 [Muribaculaceae bacterium]|nr:hypothetical protein [Muribaculaceae bacterium]
MNKFLWILALTVISLTAKAEIITQKPDGDLKYYQRTGGLTYLNDGSQLHLQNQAGFTEIVYSADGTKAWIKNPIAGFFPEGNDDCAWIEGELNGDGSIITVMLGQDIFYDENQNDGLQLCLLDKDPDSHDTNFIYNTIEVQVKYSVEGDKVSLLGTSDKRILGLAWKSNKSWSGFGDYNTVYSEYEIPEAVTPPAGIELKEYPLTAVEYMNETDQPYSTVVSVGFDGDDVYIQGLDKFIPQAWVKGTLNADKSRVTFAVQYIGTDPGQRRHFLTGWKLGVGGVDDLEINYYADLDAFESTSPVIINSNPTMHNYYAYYRSLYIGDRPDPIELPDGLTTTRMMMNGKSDDTGIFYRDFTRVVDMAIDDDKVYFRGLSFDLPEAWAWGTLNDNKLTIPAGQFLGFGEASAVYLHGMNDAMTAWQDIVFDYDKDANKFTSECTMIEASARQPRTYSWRYQSGVTIYFDENAPTGADPDDLEAVKYILSGECYSNTSLIVNGKFSRDVYVARDGNLVYIKGLSPEIPDVWVKGEMLNNVVAFTCPQHLGHDGNTDLYFSGVDLNQWVLKDFSLSFNPDDASYTFADYAVINKNTTSPSYTVWYLQGCKMTVDTTGISDVTVDESDDNPHAVYNLQGIKVTGELKNGQIYIIDGKKVLR